MAKLQLQGETFLLKSFTVDDITDSYIRWLNDPKITQFLEIKYQAWSKADAIEYVQSFEATDSKLLFGIYHQEKHIGNASLYDINCHTKTFTFGLLIGDESYWGKGVALEACSLMFDYAFKQLKMRKFFGGAYSNQLASRIVLKQLGCVEEARLIERFVYKGKLVDQVLYTITAEQWLTDK
jgi:ribosomal-protein-alanine N-acetyltransferase